MSTELMERARALATGGQDILPQETAAATPSTQNPSNDTKRSVAERQRIPMSTTVQKLFVPDIPGFHLHWFRGTPERIHRAQQAGYQFVEPVEVDLNNLDIGGESAASGNTDLGSRVSVVSGEESARGEGPVRLILMKLPEEFWRADQQAVADHNERIAEAIRGGRVGAGKAGGETPTDAGLRYTKQADNLFTKKQR